MVGLPERDIEILPDASTMNFADGQQDLASESAQE